MDLHNLRVASDCVNTVRNIQDCQIEAIDPYGQINQEINARKLDFSIVEIIHERKESNIDAHMVAKRTLHDSIGRHVWFLTPPDGVCNYRSIDA
ncbi:hypothetical protein BS78_06G115900 [Paspalum vaginatum]|nr:hypothetical protein BS78_06G115900 [Paspalum vaginatum]